MKTIGILLFASFVWGTTLIAQTAQFPSSVASVQQLGQVANGVTGTLNNSLTTSSTSMNITNGTCTLAGQSTACSVAFQPNMFLTIQNEIVQVCSMSAGSGVEVLNFGIVGSSCPSLSGRGLDGTQIAVHTTPSFPNKITVNNNITAWTHNANSAEIIAIENRLGPVSVSVLNYGVFADGIGTTGTDQLANITSAVAAIHTTRGGTIIFPPSVNGKCYYVNGQIQLYSNMTVKIDKGACVQSAAGNIGTTVLGGPVFNAGDPSTTNTNIWFKGEGLIDGNKSNITGTGDNYNQGINFESCTNCGIRDINIENAWTGGVSVACTSGTPGDNVRILNVNISNSRRNNFENLCGTNTHISNSTLMNAGGGSFSVGLDNEPFASGQLTTGLTVTDTTITGNASGCIYYISPYDTNPVVTFNNVTCIAPVDQTGLQATNNSGTPGSTVINIIGGNYSCSGVALGCINIAGFGMHNVVGVTSKGGYRGLGINLIYGSVIAGSYAQVTNSEFSGSFADINNNAYTTYNNTKLDNNLLIQTANTVNIGIVTPAGGCTANASGSGIVTSTGGTTNNQIGCSGIAYLGGGPNYAIGLNDGTHKVQLAWDNGIGAFVLGSINGFPICIYGGGNDTGTMYCIDATGSNFYLNGLRSFASNAAAAAASPAVPVNGIYAITGTNPLQLGVRF